MGGETLKQWDVVAGGQTTGSIFVKNIVGSLMPPFYLLLPGCHQVISFLSCILPWCCITPTLSHNHAPTNPGLKPPELRIPMSHYRNRFISCTCDISELLTNIEWKVRPLCVLWRSLSTLPTLLLMTRVILDEVTVLLRVVLNFFRLFTCPSVFEA